MPNTTVTKKILDDALKPILEDVALLKKSDEARANEFVTLGKQVAELKGNMDASLTGIEKRVAEGSDRNDKHASKLEGLFLKFNEELKDVVEKGQADSRVEIQKINDIFDIGGHTDNAFSLKVFMRAIRQERKEREDGKKETKSHIRTEGVKMFYKVLWAILLLIAGGIGTMTVFGSHVSPPGTIGKLNGD